MGDVTCLSVNDGSSTVGGCLSRVVQDRLLEATPISSTGKSLVSHLILILVPGDVPVSPGHSKQSVLRLDSTVWRPDAEAAQYFFLKCSVTCDWLLPNSPWMIWFFFH